MVVSLCVLSYKSYSWVIQKSNSLMTNVEIARSLVQKEKPKPNGYIRSIFNEMTNSKGASQPASQPANTKMMANK